MGRKRPLAREGIDGWAGLARGRCLVVVRAAGRDSGLADGVGDRLAWLTLIVRAAALADKPGELLQWAYWTRVTSRSYEKNLAGHRLRLTLATVTSAMGDERSRPDVREDALREFLELNGSHSEEQIQSAKTKATELLEEMNRTRMEVLGLPITTTQGRR
jgi:hypothetical protein